MNGYYNDYNRVVFETPDEREQKRKKLKRLFSRVFLALFIYIIASQLISIGALAAAKRFLSADQYSAITESATWSLIISCTAQYLVAFPVLMLMLVGTDKAQKKEKTKLSFGDFILLFLIGQSLMYVGNLIGTMLNRTIGSMTGTMPENSIETIVSGTPMWLIFILMVIVAPIVEELIFRKLMIDRLSIYGDRAAILFSAVAFGLMHGNLYQFFYAALLGALLGYVYTSTRDVRYTVLMHMIINFMGSVVALPVQNAMYEFYDIMAQAQLGEQINVIALIISGAVTLIYSNIQYGMIIGGIIALVYFIRNKKIRVSEEKEIFLPNADIYKFGVLNVGAILFMGISVITTILSLIFV